MLFPLLLLAGGAVVFFTVGKWVFKAAGTVSGWAAKAAKLVFKLALAIFVIYLIGVGLLGMIGN